ncbi:MAG TPA: TolC family protein, partial [Stenomitos sp.]
MRPSALGLALVLVLGAAGSAVAKELSLTEARTLLSDHSAKLRSDREALATAEAGIEAAFGAFVPRWSAAYGVPQGDGAQLSTQPTTGLISNALRMPLPVGGGELALSTAALTPFNPLGSSATSSVDAGHSGAMQLLWKQPLLRGGRWSGLADRWQEAAWLRDAQRAKLEESRLQENLSLEQAYWNLVLRQATVRLLEEEVDRARTNHRAVSERVKARLAAEFELFETEQTIAQFQAQLAEAQQEADAAEAALVTVMGIRPGPDRIQPTEALDAVETASPLAPEALVADALRRRPELVARRAQYEAARLEAQLAGRDRLPDLSLQVGVDWEGTPMIAGVLPRPEGSANVGVGMVFETPLGVSPESAAEREAEGRRRTLAIALDQAELAVSEEVRQLLFLVQHQADQLRYARLAQTAADKRYQAEWGRYQGGLVDVQELLRYHRALSLARLDVLKAQAGLRIASARLHAATA